MFDCWNFPLSFLVSMYRSLRFFSLASQFLYKVVLVRRLLHSLSAPLPLHLLFDWNWECSFTLPLPIFWIVTSNIHSLWFTFLSPRTSSHVPIHRSLLRFQYDLMSVESSSVSPWRGAYLLARLSLKLSCFDLSLSRPTLYLFWSLRWFFNFFSRSLICVYHQVVIRSHICSSHHSNVFTRPSKPLVDSK